MKDFLNILFVLFTETKKLKAKQKILFGKNCNAELVIYIHVNKSKIIVELVIYIHVNKSKIIVELVIYIHVNKSKIIVELVIYIHVINLKLLLNL